MKLSPLPFIVSPFESVQEKRSFQVFTLKEVPNDFTKAN